MRFFSALRQMGRGFGYLWVGQSAYEGVYFVFDLRMLRQRPVTHPLYPPPRRELGWCDNLPPPAKWTPRIKHKLDWRHITPSSEAEGGGFRGWVVEIPLVSRVPHLNPAETLCGSVEAVGRNAVLFRTPTNVARLWLLVGWAKFLWRCELFCFYLGSLSNRTEPTPLYPPPRRELGWRFFSALNYNDVIIPD